MSQLPVSYSTTARALVCLLLAPLLACGVQRLGDETKTGFSSSDGEQRAEPPEKVTPSSGGAAPSTDGNGPAPSEANAPMLEGNGLPVGELNAPLPQARAVGLSLYAGVAATVVDANLSPGSQLRPVAVGEEGRTTMGFRRGNLVVNGQMCLAAAADADGSPIELRACDDANVLNVWGGSRELMVFVGTGITSRQVGWKKCASPTKPDANCRLSLVPYGQAQTAYLKFEGEGVLVRLTASSNKCLADVAGVAMEKTCDPNDGNQRWSNFVAHAFASDVNSVAPRTAHGRCLGTRNFPSDASAYVGACSKNDWPFGLAHGQIVNINHNDSTGKRAGGEYFLLRPGANGRFYVTGAYGGSVGLNRKNAGYTVGFEVAP